MIFAMSFISCGGDEGCASDFAGTYVGSNECTGVVNDRVEVIITGTDGDYEVSGLYTAELDQDGCTLSFSNTLLGVGERAVFTLTDSLTLNIVQRESASNLVLCNFNGRKQ